MISEGLGSRVLTSRRYDHPLGIKLLDFGIAGIDLNLHVLNELGYMLQHHALYRPLRRLFAGDAKPPERTM